MIIHYYDWYVIFEIKILCLLIEQMNYLCYVTIPCTRSFCRRVVKYLSCFLNSMKYWYSNCLAFIFVSKSSIEGTSKLSELVHSLIICFFLRFISFRSSIVMSPEMIFLQVTSNWVWAQAQILCQSSASFKWRPEGLKMVYVLIYTRKLLNTP